MRYRKICGTFSGISILIMILLLIILPDIGRNGVITALDVCARIVIPSLFPFAFCVLFIMKSGILEYLKILEPFTLRVFGQTGAEFAVFLLSLIGGYPVGGRLIKELCDTNSTDRKRAEILLCYCVNCGPAFAVIAVGSGILGSITVGYIFLGCSILSSLIMAALGSVLLKKQKTVPYRKDKQTVNFADVFVESASAASASVFSICVFVIIFSVITSYLLHFSANVPLLKYTICFLEVTSGILQTKNIYLISFLLGFSGICVWMQIMAGLGDIKANFLAFAVSRIVHGGLSALFTYVAVKIFKPTLPTMTNGIKFTFNGSISTVHLTVALVSMGLLFCISVFGKKSCGSFSVDVL